MNYLKKKLNVKKPKQDDDDDYVEIHKPVVPLHPNVVKTNQQAFGNQQEEPEVLPSDPDQLLEYLKQKELKRLSQEKERLKQIEEANKNKEDWKFFLSLTQKVQQTVSQTQSAIEKIKETSAVDQIINSEEEEIPKLAGEWIAFDEGGFPNHLNGKTETEEQQENIKLEEKVEVANNNINNNINLLDDFFAPATDEPAVCDVVENNYLDDPFDTSFVDVSSVSIEQAKELIKSRSSNEISELKLNCSDSQSIVKPSSIDISPVSPQQPQFKSFGNRLSRTSSRDSIMSNPFVCDMNDEEFEEYTSGTNTPLYSPKRRDSFDDQQTDYPVASAIADLTADFCQSVLSSEQTFHRVDRSQEPEPEPEPEPEVQGFLSQEPEPEFKPQFELQKFEYQEILPQETEPEVEPQEVIEPEIEQEIEPQEGGFDPFQTIHDDETPKRQSLTDEVKITDESLPSPPPQIKNGKNFISAFDDRNFVDQEKLEETTLNNTISSSSISGQRTELFNNGNFVAEQQHQQQQQQQDEEAYQTITPPPPQYFDPFETVIPDEELVSPSPPPPPPLNEPEFQSKHSFEETAKPFEPEPEPTKTSQRKYSFERRLSTQDSINDVGQPNENAVGIINDAFDDGTIEHGIQHEQQLPSENIEEPQDVNEEPQDVNEEPQDVNEETQEVYEPMNTVEPPNENEAEMIHEDPFDTSMFDSVAFDRFNENFESQTTKTKTKATYDPFASPLKSVKKGKDEEQSGFDSFDPFSKPNFKVPKNTPLKTAKVESKDSFDDYDDNENIKIVIKAKMKDKIDSGNNAIPAPLLPPPPKIVRPTLEELKQQDEEQIDEFEALFSRGTLSEAAQAVQPISGDDQWPSAFDGGKQQTEHETESPQTPLYDEDTSVPLEEFPVKYQGDGWEMMLRYPNKKKLTANRFWKKIFVRFLSENAVLQLFNKKEDNEPFQEVTFQPTYSLSEIAAQHYDQFGKIFTIKLQYIFYRERVGVRPGQIAKVMQGQIMSMGQIAKLGMPLEHAPQISELLKLGTMNYQDLKDMVNIVEETLFRMKIPRERPLQYKTEEIQCVVQDELYVEQNKLGTVTKQLARVRIFFLSFLNGMPVIEVGINDVTRQGKEVVGRHDIIPVVTEEWIRLEAFEFHSVVQPEEFYNTRIIKLIPPDACHFELMRFRIRPPRNRELPLQVSANMNITKSKIEIKCEVLVPGCISRKHGQIPCEDIQIRFHIPECWIYFFRVEKHFRYGALKSVNRRQGKIKGIERLLGTAQNQEPQIIEVTAGQAKYEHVHHSIVWRMPRLPKEGQGAYTTQFMLVRLPLTSFDQMPDSFYEFVHVEFKMPSTTVSHTTLRSISVSNENPPEKYVRYIAKYEYKIDLSITYDDKQPQPEYIATVADANQQQQNTQQENIQQENANDNDNDEEESD